MSKLKNLNILLILYLLVFISNSIYLFYLVDLRVNYVSFFGQAEPLSFISLGLFLPLALVGSVNAKNWILLLPIVILSVPNAVNDLLPSFYMQKPEENSAASSSILTHIDLYLLIGLRFIRRAYQGLEKPIISPLGVFVFVISVLFSSIISGIYSPSIPIFSVFNVVQIRYLLLTIVLLKVMQNVGIKSLVNGIYAGAILLICESLIFTYVGDYKYLTSGNFGTNTLAVLLTTISILLLYTSNYTSISKVLVVCGLVVLVSFITDTRSVVVALCLAYITFYYLRMSFFGRLMVVLTGILFLAIMWASYDDKIVELGAFFASAFNSYEIVESGGLITNRNSSIMTRLSMIFSACSMIASYPFGVGYAGWHYLASEYGMTIPVFIDPHNDYIFSILNYGWISVIIYFSVVYIIPYKKFDAIQFSAGKVLILFVGFANLTNSNFYKHQFFMFYIVALSLFWVLCNRKVSS